MQANSKVEPTTKNTPQNTTSIILQRIRKLFENLRRYWRVFLNRHLNCEKVKTCEQEKEASQTSEVELKTILRENLSHRESVGDSKQTGLCRADESSSSSELNTDKIHVKENTDENVKENADENVKENADENVKENADEKMEDQPPQNMSIGEAFIKIMDEKHKEFIKENGRGMTYSEMRDRWG